MYSIPELEFSILKNRVKEREKIVKHIKKITGNYCFQRWKHLLICSHSFSKNISGLSVIFQRPFTIWQITMLVHILFGRPKFIVIFFKTSNFLLLYSTHEYI